MVITESDTILQEYYITRKYKSTLYEEIYITKDKRCSRAVRGASRANQEESLEEELRRCLSFCCALIATEGSAAHSDSYNKATKVKTLGSGHEDLGLSDATRRVHMIKPIGMLKQSHACMIKWCGSSMQVPAMTSNIKEIKGTTVNPKSSKYMYINKSELINMHRKRYGEHRYT